MPKALKLSTQPQQPDVGVGVGISVHDIGVPGHKQTLQITFKSGTFPSEYLALTILSTLLKPKDGDGQQVGKPTFSELVFLVGK